MIMFHFRFGPLSMEPPVKVRRDRNAVKKTKKTEKPDANQLVKPKQVKLFFRKLFSFVDVFVLLKVTHS